MPETERRASTPDGQLPAIFDAFDGWFRRDYFEACAFVSLLPETGPEHPIGVACLDYLERICEMFAQLTHTEIAEQLSLPEGTVKGRMRLGLRDQIQESGQTIGA